MSHLFISYSKQDLGFARHIKSLLEAEGFTVWLDETRLMTSDRWWQTIEHNIEACAAFLVIMSSRSRISDWVEREILYAERLRKPIFPVLLNGAAWPRLANIQYADMRAGFQAALPRDLVKGLREEACLPLSAPTTPHWPPRDFVAKVHGWETVVAWRRDTRRGLRFSVLVGLGFVVLLALLVGGLLIGNLNVPADGAGDLRGMGADGVVPIAFQLGAATATPAPSPTPAAPPDLRLIYDDETFLLVNVSGSPLDLSRLVLEQAAASRRWNVSQWDEVVTVSTSRMSAGGCYQLVTYNATQDTPARSTCASFLGWFRSGSEQRHFWLSDDPGAAFTVRLTNQSSPFATCAIDAGECLVNLP